MALRSADLWEKLAAELPDDFEYDRKGSVVVAETEAELVASAERARVLAGLGVHGEVLDADALRREEPHAAHDLPGGVLYPGDAQLEPRLATAALVRAAVRLGAELSLDCEVVRIVREPSGRAIGVETAHGLITCGAVVIAGGVWTPALLETCGLTVPVTPRKGQIVVLERSPVVFRRKLSEAGYVAAVEADDAALQIAMVVESTPSGTALLGSSRQHVGFDREVDLSVAGEIARRAARFFPVLHNARALRVYAGLRPLTPDHIPIIGPFHDAPNICVATGHEGRGHRPRPRDRRARRRLAHGHPDAGPAVLVLAGPLRPGRAGGVVIEVIVDGGAACRRLLASPWPRRCLSSGRVALRSSPGGAPRGLYCGIGVCQECRVVVDGEVVRSCVTPVVAGMRVTTGHT